MTFLDDSSANVTTTSDIPPHPILIGSDAGGVLSALPSMMGFVPERSMVIVAILPDAPNSTRFRVGPVVRADLNAESIRDAVHAMDHALNDLENVHVLLYCVHPQIEEAEHCAEIADDIVSSCDMRMLGAWWTPAIETGGSWVDLETEEQGTIGELTDNPMHSHSAIHGAKMFANRMELDSWLNPIRSVQPLYPRTFADSATEAAEAFAVLKDACTVMEFMLSVLNEGAVLEDECSKRKVLLAAAAVARDERLHPLLVTLSAGDRAPVMRELLAETCRRTRTQVRRRVMALLSTIMAGNGEGMPAFHTLQRCGDELKRPTRAGAIDGLTTLMRGHLWQGHMEGKSKALTMRVAEHGIFWAINWSLPDENEHTDHMRRKFAQQYAGFLKLLEETVDWEAISSDVTSGPCLPERL